MKTIIITGATGSIGNAAAHALAQRGDVHLLLTGRDEAKLDAIRHDLDGYDNVIADTMTIDLSDIISVNLGLEKIKAGYPKIDAIVNCAAIYKGEQALSRHGYELMFATNHLGPFQLTTGLMTQLKAAHGSRVIMVTAPSTSSINFDDIPNPVKYSAFGQFGVTKMMNLLFAFSLAELFKGTGHAAIAFHPGL
ncbi:MAG: SDR family NAD(P)-dependent oxidoreductase, partial [Bacteroidia bacterium]|nr:SDR family NAD(P)-dependent oxidoreductase [Bacteroidia bacterium]